VIIVYRARVTGGTLCTCDENDAVEWVKPADIPWSELAFPSTREALGDFLATVTSGTSNGARKAQRDRRPR
jgi:hypothetical protein